MDEKEQKLKRSKEVFKRCRTYLLDNLDASDLVDHLFQEGAINFEGLQLCNSYRTARQRTKEMMELLDKAGPDALDKLIEALDFARIDWIVEKLRSVELTVRKKEEEEAKQNMERKRETPSMSELKPNEDEDTSIEIASRDIPEDQLLSLDEQVKLIGLADKWTARLHDVGLNDLMRDLQDNEKGIFQLFKQLLSGSKKTPEKAKTIFYKGVMSSYDTLCKVRASLERIGKRDLAKEFGVIDREKFPLQAADNADTTSETGINRIATNQADKSLLFNIDSGVAMSGGDTQQGYDMVDKGTSGGNKTGSDVGEEDVKPMKMSPKQRSSSSSLVDRWLKETEQTKAGDCGADVAAAASGDSESGDDCHHMKSTLLKRYAVGSKEKKGLCVIVRNFTNDRGKDKKESQLIRVGYKKDEERITEFFQATLGYKTFTCRNLSHSSFDELMKTVQKMLNSGKYEAFFLFVLSHGSRGHISMNKEGQGDMEGRFRDEKLYPVSQIVDYITHDEVKEMKDYPKCIFIQTCRGHEEGAAANLSADELHDDDVLKPLAIGRDILLAFACLSDKESYVTAEGSVFLRRTMDVFEEFYQQEHITDMMTEVNSLVSEHHTVKNQAKKYVYQMSQFESTLTKKFYLVPVKSAPY